jgi:peptide/nickel transport system substrate-binding protein
MKRRWYTGVMPKVAAMMLLSAGINSAQGRDLIIAQGIDVPGFDIHNHSTTAVEAVFVNLFDYLVMRDGSGELKPSLATSWEQVSETAMRFKLRKGVLFHNGKDLKAEDVKFSIERPALDKGVMQNSFYNTIKGVEVVNDYEVIVHTKEPDPILLNRLSRIGSGIVPKHYVDEVGWSGFSTRPIGTGPFQFVEWKRDDRLIMQAFDKHWRGRPAWDKLIHRTIPEDSTRVGELLSGGVDIATNIPSQDVERVKNSGVADTKPWPSFRVMTLFANMKEGSPLADPRVREAVDLAIDEKALIDTAMSGLGVPVRGSVAPGLSSVPMDLHNTYLYDPEKAVKLLKDAGYGPGKLSIKLQGPSGRYALDVEMLEVISVMLEAVGIKTEIEALEWSAYQSRVWEPNKIEGLALIGHSNSLQDGFHAVQRARCGYEFSKKTSWCDKRFDELVNLSAVTVDPEKRNAYLSEAFHRLTDSRSILFLFQVQNIVGINKAVSWNPSPDEQLWMFDAKPAAN